VVWQQKVGRKEGVDDQRGKEVEGGVCLGRGRRATSVLRFGRGRMWEGFHLVQGSKWMRGHGFIRGRGESRRAKSSSRGKRHRS
jgi:hypothetical protein